MHNTFRLFDDIIFKKVKSFSRLCSRMILACILLSLSTILFAGTKHWVGTWSCAPYAAGTNTPPSPYLANNTLRQIVRVSIGGDTLRVKFSNRTCSTPVTMNSVNIAVQTSGSAIDVSTMKQLKFDGNTSVTMAAGSTVTSDALAFPLTPNTHLAITIYYGKCKTVADMTHHYGSRTDSYILNGDQTSSADFSGATVAERWYTINSIDVWAEKSKASVACLGNSITDAYGLHGGFQNRWTDIFSQRLLNNRATANVGVLNLGIGGTNVSGTGATTGTTRYQQDVLSQSGLRWVIIFYGVNDIGGSVPATIIINTYKQMIADAHAQNIRVYGATITPFGGNAYFSDAHEAVRSEVNKWIRTAGNFDKYIDFDKVIRDPSDTTKLQSAYNNDWLHPNAAGYKFLGESIDLSLFTGSDTIFAKSTAEASYFEAERYVTSKVGTHFTIVSNVLASNNKYIVRTGADNLSAPTDDTSMIRIPFTVNKDSIYNIYARVNCPTYADDSFWMKIDNGVFSYVNGLFTNGSWGWASLCSFTLKEGKHTLYIGYRENGACLDKICVSTSSIAPTGMGGMDSSLEVRR